VNAVAIILAAGEGRRLGGAAKALLARPDGRSFLATVVDSARAAGVGEVVVVVGPPYRDEVAGAARRLNIEVVDNPEPQRGMASSVALGFGFAREQFRGAEVALLWPVDHAGVRGETAAAVLARDGDIVVPTYGGRGGHPTLFRASVWPQLAACGSAPDGARSVVRADPARVTRFEVDDPGVVADVDTPADLK
jgi:CTP:molybdopterin cytidylyltransferase MocA